MSKRYQCQNCDFETDDDTDLDMIANLHQRVMSGEIHPAGECPECGCLVHGGDQDFIESGNLPYLIGVLERQGYVVIKRSP